MRNRSTSVSMAIGVSRKNAQRCPRCQQRYVQDRQSGLCRQCGRITGTYTAATRQAAQARSRRQEALDLAALRVQVPPRVNPIRVIDGVEYEVTFP